MLAFGAGARYDAFVSHLGLRSVVLSEAGFRHAFFMRGGGASRAPFATLSFSTSVGDDHEAVAENLRRAARELEVDPTRIYFLNQVHGTDSRSLRGDEDREEVVRIRGDITLSSHPGVACAVRTADCVAILLADRKTGAVAAVHSGWRGTVAGAATAGVAALRQLGADDIVAAVGPHIEPCCFEVGPDVAAELASATPLGESVVDRSREKPHVDLRRIVERQLHDAGVAAVDHVRGCTVCDEARFHSYRRDGKRSGRMLAAIVTGCR